MLILIGLRQVGRTTSLEMLPTVFLQVSVQRWNCDEGEMGILLYIRNGLKKSIEIYFYDNGIRNAIISIFFPVICVVI